jgi:hypothetical protein
MTFTSCSLHFHKLLSLAIAVLCCLLPLAAQGSPFVSFDASDAGQRKNQGTFRNCINEDGVIAGHYIDSSNGAHSFFRSNSGVITEFDPPGLANDSVTAINHAGAMVGYGRPGSGNTRVSS